jgi:hypothetical protein
MCISIHSYKYTYTHSIPINISERVSQFDLEIYEVDHQERLAIIKNIIFH